MKPITHKLRTKIRQYIKSGIDISSLIEGYSLKGEDLSNAKIASLNRLSEDLTGASFQHAIIGTEGEITNFSGSKLVNVCFKGTRFNGKVLMRKCDCRGANFCEAWIPYVEYQWSDFTGCSFCDITWQMGSRGALGAKFDLNFFKELGKALNLEIRCRRINKETKDGKKEENTN